MAKALSNDLRERVLAAIDGGMSRRQAAARFGVSASSAIRWDDRRRREGDFRPKALGGDRRSAKIEAHAGAILSLLEAQPDLTLAELQACLGERGVRTSLSSLWRFFRRHRITRTKDRARLRTGPAGHTEAASGLDRRPTRSRSTAAGVHRRDPRVGPEGRPGPRPTWRGLTGAPRGRRLRLGLPHGHWKTTTFVAGLIRRGLIAPMVLDGPINGRAFQAYVEQVLVPELRPGDTVIMDNLGSHKGTGARDAIEAAGARLLFLPRYSPDFNPIENAFAKLKVYCYAAPQNGPLRASGTPLATSSTPSHLKSAPTTSPQPDMMQLDRKPL